MEHQREHHASEPPHVNFRSDVELASEIKLFRSPVIRRCVFFNVFAHIFDLHLSQRRGEFDPRAASKVANFPSRVFGLEHVLNLDVSVGNILSMQGSESIGDIV